MMKTSRSHSKVTINGVLLLDKPTGITSNTALQIVKRLFNARKAGHSGSLDPSASGMLPILFGEATKFAQFLLNADKRYRVIAKLGEKTTTADAEGKTIARHEVQNLTAEQLAQVLSQFHGTIQQTPPMHSALKHEGQPLYKLARQGIEIARKARKINIYSLQLIRYQKDALELEVHCSKGTYIRTLIEDIGEAMGCGAHVTMLYRFNIGTYYEQQMIPLATLKTLSKQNSEQLIEKLIPVENILNQYPIVHLDSSEAAYLRNGRSVEIDKAPQTDWVQLKTLDGHFLGLGQVLADNIIAPKRLIATNLPDIT